MTSAAPTISVVIPVYNCERTIAKCLDALAAQDHPDYEVLVVDDGSTDKTAEICKSYENVKLLMIENGGPSRARNIGAKTAAGRIIVFTDGDCIPETNWLSELEKGFVTTDVAGVGGDQKSPHDENTFGRRVQEILKLLGIVTYYTRTTSVMGEIPHNPSCNSAYLKRVLDEVGGFDERLWPGEDVDLDIRIKRNGYKLIHNPNAVVRHYRPSSYKGFSRMMRRYGASAWHLLVRYGFFRTLHYEPIVLIAGLLSGLALMLWQPWTGLFFLLPWLILFLWFWKKTTEIQKSAKFVVLFALIILNWNWGFFTGYWYRPWK